jgi:hypothetical protein
LIDIYCTKAIELVSSREKYLFPQRLKNPIIVCWTERLKGKAKGYARQKPFLALPISIANYGINHEDKHEDKK